MLSGFGVCFSNQLCVAKSLHFCCVHDHVETIDERFLEMAQELAVIRPQCHKPYKSYFVKFPVLVSLFMVLIL